MGNSGSLPIYGTWKGEYAPLSPSFPSLLILNPEVLEGKTATFKNVSFFKRKWLCHALIKQKRHDGFFIILCAFLKNTLHYMSLADKSLQELLRNYFDQGNPFPEIYFLDDLFFKAARRMALPQERWIFLLREEDASDPSVKRYALCCYHDHTFLFKRTLPQGSQLQDELCISKRYLERFGYKEQPIQLLFFSNDAQQLTIKESVAVLGLASSTMRIPFHEDQVIHVGLKEKPIKILPPLVPALAKATYLTLFRRIATRGMIFLVLGVSLMFFLNRFIHNETALINERIALQEAQRLPKNYTKFNLLEKKALPPFDLVFLEKVSKNLKGRANPSLLQAHVKDKSLKMSFKDGFKPSALEPLKKDLREYHIAMAPNALTFTYHGRKPAL